MDHLRVSSAQVDDMWAFVASMLFLGNIDFGEGDVAKISNPDVVIKCEALLGCSNFQERLVKRAMKVGSEVTMVDHNPKQAQASRDALVKIMYARLFTFLVVRCNATTDRASLSNQYIGLLDVYGFEFFEINSFEQLCINFANEKLQQFFLTTVFENEAATYKEEGIPWIPVTYADNKVIIDL